ncbi:MAG: CusA/CzcA family heavy metal efflux RND transporter [Bacteroidota bacterium]|nr:CusA/CzcA family heavy metal efflux RND transporter [Bacteroidota bacterium]
MLHAVIRFSIRNKLIVGLLLLGLIGWGSYAITKLPIDAVPDITNNQVMVITSAPSLGAPDVERFITVPIEQATRNVPGITEQRSFSRFGLSLVTIVFDDKTDVYWARQQVSERLIKVQSQIPSGIGIPELGPVTTGLGEIFQYTVRAKRGYEGKYTLSDLRTIQDWIVRRQLLGTDGVADVSSFGGLVKQYEVAVNTDKLRSFDLTIADIFKALNENNQNTGGAYIEKGPNVLFIRSEGLVKNLEDIGTIVVKKAGNVPVLIRDVADVRLGSAIRYGATVYNNEGEVAGAVVMMLKGENSNKVIGNIKKKIKEIEKSLPEGIVIEPFLDRTKMVNNAIGTVEHNLLEGALIVIFVLVLFLGNVRAGFIVASVIPLSMLFAVIMMNAFGVSGNLMSLGALDFGLLVDGAVIIVEAVMHKLSHHSGFRSAAKLNQQQMNAEVEESAGKMMNSAVFGQIIILIVYLPILTLEGIEGKMFRPMAQTVSFAIVGAFLLSLTYVPMMTSLFLSKKVSHKESFSDKMMKWFQRMYKPVLLKALALPRTIVIIAFSLFAISVFILASLGGEFIPKLEEGDFAVDTRLLTGSSLSNTIQTTQKSAGILLKQFPEVEKVVTKIGAGEIPTDPMPLEAADMMVILKDKKEWKNAESFDELAEKMSKALEAMPGIATGFQFPVQMRFNELMTGARQDVVCKIFGDDLDSLAVHADELGKLIQTVQGAKDLYIETVTGVPQMVITYNREAIARYGANVSDINNAIQSAYAGAVAGLVFEGDRRFDLVVRLNEEQKKDVDNINNLMIGLPGGTQVPLHLLANVELKDGPYQIQREDARRRITIGFNVRGRDVQSIVSELQQKVEKKIKLPPGYYITYGGQYENLQRASKRLSIAVPAALLLILVMLYFAFNKLKYSLLIFSAIPLSAIGGVIALWSRGMPFSISAGVGFIALFGVAVLNGIVLVSEMNRLRHEHIHNVKQAIIQATQVRLRPVLMTAAVASLGFLPMAISSGAGAEVQRPLATVVIGGLVSATLLTLLVLPALYLLFEKRTKKKNNMKLVGIIILVLCSSSLYSQEPVKQVSFKQVVDTMLYHNASLKVSKLQEKYYDVLKGSSHDLPKTQVSAELGNYNSAFFDSRFMVTQSFASPAYYNRQKDLLATYLKTAESQTVIQQAELEKLAAQLYTDLQYLQARLLLSTQLDSIYQSFQTIAKLRFEKGESNLLEKVSLENLAEQQQLQVRMLQEDRLSVQLQLKALLQTDWLVEPADKLQKVTQVFDTALFKTHPYLQYYRSLQQQALATTQLERSKLLPEFFAGYTNQSIVGWQQAKDRTEQYYSPSSRFSSVSVGMNIPVFTKAQKAKVEAAKVNEQVSEGAYRVMEYNLKMKVDKAFADFQKYTAAVLYYEQKGKQQSETIFLNANYNYKNGQINYIEWAALLAQANNIKIEQLAALRDQNIAETELNYLLQKK